MLDEALEAEASEQFALLDARLGGDVGNGLVGPCCEHATVAGGELLEDCGSSHGLVRFA